VGSTESLINAALEDSPKGITVAGIAKMFKDNALKAPDLKFVKSHADALVKGGHAVKSPDAKYRLKRQPAQV
jgi:hypothetical protein